jgi:hypothetical protein
MTDEERDELSEIRADIAQAMDICRKMERDLATVLHMVEALPGAVTATIEKQLVLRITPVRPGGRV